MPKFSQALEFRRAEQATLANVEAAAEKRAVVAGRLELAKTRVAFDGRDETHDAVYMLCLDRLGEVEALIQHRHNNPVLLIAERVLIQECGFEELEAIEMINLLRSYERRADVSSIDQVIAFCRAEQPIRLLYSA